MHTLEQFSKGIQNIPHVTAWYLADISKAMGRQELFTRQSPQKLRSLKEHALIESAVSSNRLEGVQIDRSRVHTVMFGKPLLRDRAEEEVHGYRKALELIHTRGRQLPVNETTLRRIHRLCRANTGDAGAYKQRGNDIIEKYPDGRERLRFRTVAPQETPAAVRNLFALWRIGLAEKWVHPLVLMAGAGFDLLCIHPFRDGNGRVSRLLLLLQCYHLSLEVGRYISLERLIETDKERYYETLEASSGQWHSGRHDPWPFVNFTLYILKKAYEDFETRIGELKSPRGAKTAMVVRAISNMRGTFRVTDLREACPAVSIDMIRRVMKDMKKEGRLICLGRGHTAAWTKKTGKEQDRGSDREQE